MGKVFDPSSTETYVETFSIKRTLGASMSRGYHDIGGNAAGAIPMVELPWLHWEKQVEAVRNLLGDGTRRLLSLDELRRGFESFGEDKYKSLSFYRRRLEAMIDILIEKDAVSRDELEQETASVRARWERPPNCEP